MSHEGFHVNKEDVEAGRIHDPEKARKMAEAGNSNRIGAIEERQRDPFKMYSVNRDRAEEAEKAAAKVYHEGGNGRLGGELEDILPQLRAKTKEEAENMSIDRINLEIIIAKERARDLELIAERRQRDIGERASSGANEAEAARITQEIKDKLEKAA